MDITKEFLKQNLACDEGFNYFIATFKDIVPFDQLKQRLELDNHPEWIVWVVGHHLNQEQLFSFCEYCKTLIDGYLGDSLKVRDKGISFYERYESNTDEKKIFFAKKVIAVTVDLNLEDSLAYALEQWRLING